MIENISNRQVDLPSPVEKPEGLTEKQTKNITSPSIGMSMNVLRAFGVITDFLAIGINSGRSSAVEQVPYTHHVGGSIPSARTNYN